MKIAPFAVERFFARHEFSARRLLSSSDCEALSLDELLSLADPDMRETWRELRLGYTESRGHPLLRREIASMAPSLQPEHVLQVVPEEGIFLTCHALLSPGDKVVVTSPSYQSLYEIARAEGCRLSFWNAQEDAGWRFDPNELRKLVAERPKLVVLNFPHNPTGWLPTRQEFDEIVGIVRESGAWLLSDEMYRFLEHEPGTTLPSAVELYERSIVLGGLSKAFSAPGLRVGWLASRNTELLDRIAALKDYTTICGSAPSELLAVIILRARDIIVERNVRRVREHVSMLDEFVSRHATRLSWSRPRASSVGLVRVLDARETATIFCERLLKDTGVLLLPSALFAMDDRHVRMGLGRADFPLGLGDFAAWLG